MAIKMNEANHIRQVIETIPVCDGMLFLFFNVVLSIPKFSSWINRFKSGRAIYQAIVVHFCQRFGRFKARSVLLEVVETHYDHTRV